MDDKRMAGAYEIILAVPVGTTEIVLGHCPDNEQFPYMVGHCTQNPLFASYHCCTYGDSYLEILKTFADEAVKLFSPWSRSWPQKKWSQTTNTPLIRNGVWKPMAVTLLFHPMSFFKRLSSSSRKF